MKLRDAIDTLVTDSRAASVYGQPYESVSGVTIIPVAKVRGRTKPGAEEAEVRLAARPVGVFVVKDGNASWEPAVDVTRIAVLGVLVGLVGTAFSTLAMVRRPPWPDLRGGVSRPN